MRIPMLSDALQRRRDRIVEQAKSRLVQGMAAELSRMATGREGGRSAYPLVASAPPGYPDSGSPHPLYGYDRPIWYATPASPRRRPDTAVDVDTLRRFADTWDPLRSIINHLKREIHAQPFSIGCRDPKDKSDSAVARAREAEAFFSRRGGLGERNESRRHFEAKILEDMLVVGAFAVWKNFNRGGSLLQAIPIDAATIRPRMDAYGWPGPGDAWYEQWIMGMQITTFQPEDLVYEGLWPITNSPWFRSPVEYLVATCLSGLKADEWNRSWLTDGNEPGKMVQMPESWLPAQITEFWDFFEARVLGSAKRRNGMIPVPAGVKATDGHSRKDQDFAEFEVNLIRRACAMFGVQPASIGFAGEQYKVSQEGAHAQTTQFGAGQIIGVRNALYNDILEDLGYSDLCVVEHDSAEESPLQKTQRQQIQGGNIPSKTLNELRQENGDPPIEGGDVVMVSNLLVPLHEAQASPKDPEPPKDAADETDDADGEAEDIARWERKALRRVKDGKSPSCTFTSGTISGGRASKIADGLIRAKTASEVRALFASADDAEPSFYDRREDAIEP